MYHHQKFQILSHRLSHTFWGRYSSHFCSLLSIVCCSENIPIHLASSLAVLLYFKPPHLQVLPVSPQQTPVLSLPRDLCSPAALHNNMETAPALFLLSTVTCVRMYCDRKNSHLETLTSFQSQNKEKLFVELLERPLSARLHMRLDSGRAVGRILFMFLFQEYIRRRSGSDKCGSSISKKQRPFKMGPTTQNYDSLE
jgi:hypothetical protein